MTQREQILDIVEARLQAIQTANGYHSDAGLTVAIGEIPVIGPSDPATQLAVLVGDDEVVSELEKITITLPIDVAVVTRIDTDGAWRTVERVLGDVKQAMETDTAGHRIDGLTSPRLRRGPTRTLPREDGSVVTGVVVRYLVESYVEAWGLP